jgi:hypothetical protein
MVLIVIIPSSLSSLLGVIYLIALVIYFIIIILFRFRYILGNFIFISSLYLI